MVVEQSANLKEALSEQSVTINTAIVEHSNGHNEIVELSVTMGKPVVSIKPMETVQFLSYPSLSNKLAFYNKHIRSRVTVELSYLISKMAGRLADRNRAIVDQSASTEQLSSNKPLGTGSYTYGRAIKSTNWRSRRKTMR
jgi:hypothetical protein